jgi:hypothetical protein
MTNNVNKRNLTNALQSKNSFIIAKGQLISELLFDFLDFSKNQLKNLMNFCPRI